MNRTKPGQLLGPSGQCQAPSWGLALLHVTSCTSPCNGPRQPLQRMCRLVETWPPKGLSSCGGAESKASPSGRSCTAELKGSVLSCSSPPALITLLFPWQCLLLTPALLFTVSCSPSIMALINYPGEKFVHPESNLQITQIINF